MNYKLSITNCQLPIIFAGLLLVTSCKDSAAKGEPEKPATPVSYESLSDPIRDVGQYNLLEMKRLPTKYRSCTSVLGNATRNSAGKTNQTEGIQYHLLCQSIAGLTNRAVDEGKSDFAVWLHDHEGRESYRLSKKALDDMGIAEQGSQTGIELAVNNKNLFDGYVLTDVENNPESNLVASVAAHVYNSIIVDVRDKSFFDAAGYTMTYDASQKTTANAWAEFKDRCSNKALVVMPVQTGELRNFAIKNNLFILNINKKANTASQGQNLSVFEQALAWLEPGAPVYGWEQNVAEDVFVNRASVMGHPWIPCDWLYNLPLTSINYKSRQTQVLAKVQNPNAIDYEKEKRFVAFWLSDGDNVQWMMNDFTGYYMDANAEVVKMGFGLPSALSMMAPEQFKNLVDKQKNGCTLIEVLGGGYWYIDNFGQGNDRVARLEEQAQRVAAGMRQHRIKILGLMGHNVRSAAAIEGYKAFVEANDQLEGIVALQYSPYAGGAGDILWITNQRGYRIPIVTAKYSLWNHEGHNEPRQGSPAYIADKLKGESAKSFSLISVHAWSQFKDIGGSSSLTDEMSGGSIKGAGAANLLVRRFDQTMEVVSVQELIWRIRMQYFPDQTIEYLGTVSD
jgi:hypothetical protein